MSASDTDFVVSFWNYQVPFVGNHINSFGGARFRTGSAGSLFSLDYAIVLYEIGLAYLG